MTLKDDDICLIGCLPVDCIWNHIHVAVYGDFKLKLVNWDSTPPPDSEIAYCQIHGGPIWFNSEQRDKRDEVRRSGFPVILICLLCVKRIEVARKRPMKRFDMSTPVAEAARLYDEAERDTIIVIRHGLADRSNQPEGRAEALTRLRALFAK